VTDADGYSQQTAVSLVVTPAISRSASVGELHEAERGS